MKKMLSIVMALILTLGIGSTVFAADIATSGGTGSSTVTLNQAASMFSVTVPTNLPISIDLNGNVTTSNTAYIYNNGYGPILIKNVYIVPGGGWTLVPFTTDFKTQKVGLKQFGMGINGELVNLDGSVSLHRANWPSIPGWDALKLSYAANVAVQNTALNNLQIASLVIVVGWDEALTGEYVLADDSDFHAGGDGLFYYIGADEYVEVPYMINGVILTSLDLMFAENQTVKGVILPQSDYIESMIATFAYSTVETVERFPPNVYDMSSAFEGCEYLVTVSELPDTVEEIPSLFDGCIRLEKAPRLPENVIDMTRAVAYCERLSGVIYVDARPIYFDGFFEGTSTNENVVLTLMTHSDMFMELMNTRSPNSRIMPPV